MVTGPGVEHRPAAARTKPLHMGPTLPAELNSTPTSQIFFFRYFQLQDFARSHCPTSPQILPSSGLDHILPTDALCKQHVCYLYELVLPTSEIMAEKIKANWESELQINLSDHFWGKALEAVKSSFSCSRLSLIQVKALHRARYSKAKLANIYPDTVEDNCNRCSLSPCDFAYVLAVPQTSWVLGNIL